MFRLNFESDFEKRPDAVKDGVVKMLVFAVSSLAAVLLFCEYVLKPLWHLLLNP